MFDFSNPEKLLRKYNITPDKLKDQFFLKDLRILEKIIRLAKINRQDTVLEIGAGIGNLTFQLAEHAGKVIAFEIDKRYSIFLDQLPENVQIHYKSAWDYIQLRGKFRKRREFNKIVSNLPYSFIEPLLHNLTFLEYDLAILMIPKKFVKTIQSNEVFSSFFKVKELIEVGKDKFYPIPKTSSVVIDLQKLPDPIKERNLALFLRQYIYQHEKAKLKNSLREGLIEFCQNSAGFKLTKRQAKKILQQIFSPEYLEQTPAASEIYFRISEIFSDKKILKNLLDFKKYQ